MANLIQQILGFRSDPLGILLQLLIGLGKDRLEGELQTLLHEKVSKARHAELADDFIQIAAALKKGDDGLAAGVITKIITSIS